jgi:hypothetical protein
MAMENGLFIDDLMRIFHDDLPINGSSIDDLPSGKRL